MVQFVSIKQPIYNPENLHLRSPPASTQTETSSASRKHTASTSSLRSHIPLILFGPILTRPREPSCGTKTNNSWTANKDIRGAAYHLLQERDTYRCWRCPYIHCLNQNNTFASVRVPKPPGVEISYGLDVCLINRK